MTNLRGEFRLGFGAAHCSDESFGRAQACAALSSAMCLAGGLGAAIAPPSKKLPLPRNGDNVIMQMIISTAKPVM